MQKIRLQVIVLVEDAETLHFGLRFGDQIEQSSGRIRDFAAGAASPITLQPAYS
jgi:hypothetical protein